jgi:PKD repeat protein
VTTDSPSNVTATSATLNGSVTLNDDTDGSYTFTWGTSTSGTGLGSSTGTVTAGSVGATPSEGISSLSPATTYYYQLCATNTVGQGCGSVQQLTTLPAAPDATTGSGSPSTSTTSATLNGSVNPNGDLTSFVFYYDTTSHATGSCGDYPTSTASGSAGSGTNSTAVSKTLTGLSANTTYYFRLSAANNEGTTCSTVESSFTTPNVPASVTGSATSVGASGATLNGTVNPQGSNVSTTVFKYCTGCANASSGSIIAATPSPGSGTSPVSVSATPSGLQSGVTFHYELCATNAYGTSCGSDLIFKTDTPPVASLSATSPTTGPVPLTVNFDGSASSDPDSGDSVQSYTFSFGDGSSSVTQSTPTISHTYSSPCSPCTASLTVTDKEGATSTASTVTIHANANQAPVSTLTSTPTPATGTVPLSVTFDGSASHDPDGSIASWSLNFGDSNSTSGTGAVPSSITHTYSTAGTYHAVLTVTDSSNASTPSAAVTVTVNPQPTITVANVSQNEGNSGSTNFLFGVTLSAISTNDVTVDYATADGTATTAGSDYTAESGTLTIPAGTDCTAAPATNSACQIAVPVNGDTLYENDETFALNLLNPTGATLVNSSATGTILNDDPKPVLMIEDNGVTEGNAGSIVAGAQTWAAGGNLQLQDASGFPNTPGDTFDVTTPHSASVSTFTYSGVSGNTLTGVTPGGSVTAGQIASQPVAIPLTVLLCDPSKMPLGTSSVNDCQGKAETASGVNTTVNYSTIDGRSYTTGIPVVMGQDYLSSSGTLMIPAGATSGQIVVYEIPNTTPENPSNPLYDLDRWFTVSLDRTAVTNATVARALGSAHILDDDGANKPTATTGPASAIGTSTATIAATANGEGPATTVWVDYGTTDSYGTSTPTKAIAAGTSGDQSLSFDLSGLSAGTTYHYRVVAAHTQADGGAVAYGKDMTFTTDRPPIAKLAANPTTGPVKLNVTFDGSGSSDPDGSIASWTLAFGDGSSKTGTGPVPSAITHTYTSPCSCTAALTVTDNQGAQSAPAKDVIKPFESTAAGPTLSNAILTAIATSAKIIVTVNPNGAPSQVWISYGATNKYGQTSQAQTVRAGATKRLTFLLPGLSPGTRYHYQIVGWHTAVDSGTTYSNDTAFSTLGPKRMVLALKKQVLRVTATGSVALPFYCGGSLLWSCKGQAQLSLGNRVVGSKSFSVPRLQRKLVSLKLKTSVLQRLGSRGLRLDVTITVRTGRGGDLAIKQITLLPPLKAKH